MAMNNAERKIKINLVREHCSVFFSSGLHLVFKKKTRPKCKVGVVSCCPAKEKKTTKGNKKKGKNHTHRVIFLD